MENSKIATQKPSRKEIGGRYVDAAAVWSAPKDDSQAACLTELTFKA